MLILSYEPSHFLQNFDRFTVKRALLNTQNDCHQWLSDSSKLHQICFRQGLCPDTAGGAYSAPPDPIVGLRALLLRDEKGGEGKGGEEKRGKREREGRGYANEPSHFSESSDAF